jgi:hypothetical protein
MERKQLEELMEKEIRHIKQTFEIRETKMRAYMRKLEEETKQRESLAKLERVIAEKEEKKVSFLSLSIDKTRIVDRIKIDQHDKILRHRESMMRP